MRRLLVLASVLCLPACSTVGKGVGDTFRMTGNGVGAAVSAPFRDFNLMRVEVPPALASAASDPYMRPVRMDCAWLEHEITQLDLALGPDLDVPRDAERPGMGRRGSVAASEAALDAVRDVTTGWIPFRSVVRRLTGAAQNQDEIEDAVQAGAVRRAYLKGLGLQQNCAHPAAPLPATSVASQGEAFAAGEPPAARPAAAQSPVAPYDEADTASGAPGV